MEPVSMAGSGEMAVGEGFEPPVGLHRHWFSKPAHSATLPSHRISARARAHASHSFAPRKSGSRHAGLRKLGLTRRGSGTAYRGPRFFACPAASFARKATTTSATVDVACSPLGNSRR